MTGIRNFCCKHVCNAVCVGLNLTHWSISDKDEGMRTVGVGTIYFADNLSRHVDGNSILLTGGTRMYI
ncbi:hypothetical protein ACHAXH_002004 [Discostella pseudostelligera]